MGEKYKKWTKTWNLNYHVKNYLYANYSYLSTWWSLYLLSPNISFHVKISAHAMIISQHALIGSKIKFVVIWSEFSEVDCAVLVDGSSDFHDGSSSHLFGVSSEFYYFDLGLCKNEKNDRKRDSNLVTYHRQFSCRVWSLRLCQLFQRMRQTNQRVVGSGPWMWMDELAWRLLIRLPFDILFNLFLIKKRLENQII